MATTKATTVEAYLAELPAGTRESIARVRDLVNRHMPAGYHEAMGFGMITWSVPLESYRATYNGQPLCYVGLAAQKNFNSLYLMGSYAQPDQRARLEKAYDDVGRRLDMGKSCLHFKSADELPTALIGDLIASTPPSEMVAVAESSHAGRKKKAPATKQAPKNAPATKQAPAKGRK